MDVKLLRLTTGEDVVAELVYADPSITTIKKPFVIALSSFKSTTKYYY